MFFINFFFCILQDYIPQLEAINLRETKSLDKSYVYPLKPNPTTAVNCLTSKSIPPTKKHCSHHVITTQYWSRFKVHLSSWRT